MSWLEPLPPQTLSWGTSSKVSDATPDDLTSGSEEMTAQQEKMREAITKLLAVVSEVGRGPWDASPGLTEGLLITWLGQQEDRGDDLKEKVDRKQDELARLVKWWNQTFSNPKGKVWGLARTLPMRTTPAGSNKAKTSGNRQARKRTNEPQGRVGGRTGTGFVAPCKRPPGEGRK